MNVAVSFRAARRRVLLPVGLAATILGSAARAESVELAAYCGSLGTAAETAAEGVDLCDALREALAGSPDLAAIRAGTAAADGRVDQAGRGPNPALEASVENVAGSGAARGVEEVGCCHCATLCQRLPAVQSAKAELSQHSTAGPKDRRDWPS